ncbi:MAG: hypothetical protein J6C19_05025 [Lachnospiraceae bacterium]|nr:hypothetical protein [Lachnospiraceae bacterium]
MKYDELLKELEIQKLQSDFFDYVSGLTGIRNPEEIKAAVKLLECTVELLKCTCSNDPEFVLAVLDDAKTMISSELEG